MTRVYKEVVDLIQWSTARYENALRPVDKMFVLPSQDPPRLAPPRPDGPVLCLGFGHTSGTNRDDIQFFRVNFNLFHARHVQDINIFYFSAKHLDPKKQKKQKVICVKLAETLNVLWNAIQMFQDMPCTERG